MMVSNEHSRLQPDRIIERYLLLIAEDSVGLQKISEKIIGKNLEMFVDLEEFSYLPLEKICILIRFFCEYNNKSEKRDVVVKTVRQIMSILYEKKCTQVPLIIDYLSGDYLDEYCILQIFAGIKSSPLCERAGILVQDNIRLPYVDNKHEIEKLNSEIKIRSNPLDGIINRLCNELGKNSQKLVEEKIIRVIVSSTTSGNPISVIANDEGFWCPKFSGNDWLEVDFCSKKINIVAFTIISEFIPKIKISGSNDGKSFSTIELRKEGRQDNCIMLVTHFTEPQKNPYRFIRINFIDPSPPRKDVNFKVHRIEFFGDVVPNKDLFSETNDNIQNLQRIFVQNSDRIFDGILKELFSENSLMIETSSSLRRKGGKNIFSGENQLIFSSANLENSWIMFDLMNKKVCIRSYSIESFYLRSFMLEGSDDKVNWVLIDNKNDIEEFLIESKTSMTFSITAEKQTPFRYIKLTQTSMRWVDEDHYFLIYHFEIFGKLFHKK